MFFFYIDFKKKLLKYRLWNVRVNAVFQNGIPDDDTSISYTGFT